MKVTIEGNYLSTSQGTSKAGNEYLFTRVLTPDDDVLRIFDYDPGSSVKRYDPVSVKVDMREGEKGLFVSLAKD